MIEPGTKSKKIYNEREARERSKEEQMIFKKLLSMTKYTALTT